MCWIKKGEGFNQGKAALLDFFNLVKVAEEVLRKGKGRWRLSYKILVITLKYYDNKCVLANETSCSLNFPL